MIQNVVLSLILFHLVAGQDTLSQTKTKVKPPVPVAPQKQQHDSLFTRLNPGFLGGLNQAPTGSSGSSFRSIEREIVGNNDDDGLLNQQRRRPAGRFVPSLTGDAEPRSRDRDSGRRSDRPFPYDFVTPSPTRRWTPSFPATPRPMGSPAELAARNPATNSASYRSEQVPAPPGIFSRFYPHSSSSDARDGSSEAGEETQKKVPFKKPNKSGLKSLIRETRAAVHLNPEIPLRCLQEVIVGACDASITRYAYNREAGKCESFEYTGCRGNRNNFVTQRECNKSCLVSQ